MITKEKEQMLELYNKGLGFYQNRKFKEGLEMFKKCLDLVPNDGPSQLYIDRCQDFLQDPPPDNWDGVYVMKTK